MRALLRRDGDRGAAHPGGAQGDRYWAGRCVVGHFEAEAIDAGCARCSSGFDSGNGLAVHQDFDGSGDEGWGIGGERIAGGDGGSGGSEVFGADGEFFAAFGGGAGSDGGTVGVEDFTDFRRGGWGDLQKESSAASAVGAAAGRVLALGGEAYGHDFDVMHGASCAEEGSSTGDDGERSAGGCDGRAGRRRSAGEACEVEVADGRAVGLEEFPTDFGDGGPGYIADRTAGVGRGRHADGVGADDQDALGRGSVHFGHIGEDDVGTEVQWWRRGDGGCGSGEAGLVGGVGGVGEVVFYFDLEDRRSLLGEGVGGEEREGGEQGVIEHIYSI